MAGCGPGFGASLSGGERREGAASLGDVEALLLTTRYDLSDAATPERTAFVRFRRRLVAHGLESKGACVRKGTSPQSLTAIASLVDAAAIGAAGRRQRGRLGRAPHGAPAHGYKARIAADKDSGIVRAVETAPANEADVSIAPAIVPDEPGRAGRGLCRPRLRCPGGRKGDRRRGRNLEAYAQRPPPSSRRKTKGA